ncbi:MAG: hypothetical protein R6V38_04660, partial [Roseovarius gahaiensis]
MIWVALAVLAGLAGLWLWVTARYMVRATDGPRIPPRPGTALLLIETQQAFWSEAHHDAATRMRVVAAIAREVELARHKDQPVIALRQEWRGLAPRLIARITRPGAPRRGGPDTGLAEPFQGMADHVIVKRVEDGFETGIDYRGYGRSTGAPDIEGTLHDAEAGLRWLIDQPDVQN